MYGIAGWLPPDPPLAWEAIADELPVWAESCGPVDIEFDGQTYSMGAARSLLLDHQGRVFFIIAPVRVEGSDHLYTMLLDPNPE